MFYVFPFPRNIYVPFLIPFAILIKAVSYLLLNQVLPLLLLSMSFSLMFGPHMFHLLLVLPTMLFLLTIISSIFGFTLYIASRMFIQPLSPSSTLLRTLYINNGGVFLTLRSFLATHGITNLTTPPHTFEHNGYSEHPHWHIIETSLTLSHQASIPLTFWSYAFATTIYLINKIPKVGLSLGSFFEKLFHNAPDPSKLCLWLFMFSLVTSLCFP